RKQCPTSSPYGCLECMGSVMSVEPERHADRLLTMAARPYPLYPALSAAPPSGDRNPPFITSDGSSVGRPEGSKPQPGGICWPSTILLRTFPEATVVEAISSTKCRPSALGAA